MIQRELICQDGGYSLDVLGACVRSILLDLWGRECRGILAGTLITSQVQHSGALHTAGIGSVDAWLTALTQDERPRRREALSRAQETRTLISRSHESSPRQRGRIRRHSASQACKEGRPLPQVQVHHIPPARPFSCRFRSSFSGGPTRQGSKATRHRTATLGHKPSGARSLDLEVTLSADEKNVSEPQMSFKKLDTLLGKAFDSEAEDNEVTATRVLLDKRGEVDLIIGREDAEVPGAYRYPPSRDHLFQASGLLSRLLLGYSSEDPDLGPGPIWMAYQHVAKHNHQGSVL